jgi:hypothetical protein
MAGVPLNLQNNASGDRCVPRRDAVKFTQTPTNTVKQKCREQAGLFPAYD